MVILNHTRGESSCLSDKAASRRNIKMAADHDTETKPNEDHGQLVEQDTLNATDVAIRRSSWAKKSREMKDNPWKFPKTPSETELASHNKENDTDAGVDTDKDLTVQGTADSMVPSESIDKGESRKHRCRFFLQVSLNIDSVDEIDGVCEEGDSECLQAVNFVKSVPVDTRSMVAKYLSTGNPEHLAIAKDNLHHIFHLAKMLNLNQLYNQCMRFCMNEANEELVPLFDNCECVQDIIQESKTGYQRFISIVSSESDGDDISPEFYVVISQDGAKSDEKRTLKVIDMAGKSEIFQRDISNMQQLGKGSDFCCCYKKESPYIFACGGDGKSAQLCWKYDVLLGRWNKCTKMLQARSQHRLVSSGNGSVFAIGGVETANIDEYSVKTNKWTCCGTLQKHIQIPVCAMYMDRIYILGGRTAAGPVATVQCFDKSTRIVSRLPDLPCEFADGKAVVFEEKLYIATEQGHMICFVPETGESYLCAQQPVQRHSFGMFLKSERIYLVGGVAREEEDGPTETPMYRYNPKKDTWTAETDLCKSFPVYSDCSIRYPKCCPIVPFDDKF